MPTRNLTASFGILSLLLAGACGDEGTTSTSATSSASSTSSTSGGGGEGTTGSGGMTGSGSTTGSTGSGGSGGSFADVNPIAGVTKDSVQKVASNFGFVEGPVWNAKEGVLLFSDIPMNTIHVLTPPSKIAVFRTPSDNSNGLALDEKGLLIASEHGARRVSRTLADKSVVPIVAMYMGKKLNSPNDVIVRSDGNIYFTDPPYGLADPGQSELGFFGVYRVAPDKSVTLIAMDMQRPNGIALSPDESKLYATDTQTAELRVFDVAADGAVSNGKKLVTTSPGPDGMGVDDAGNLYITTSVGVEVLHPDGSKWGVIEVAEQPANCAFGGADRKTLYITARTGLYSVVLNVPGKP